MFAVPFVTERFGKTPYRDCSWASALMLYLKATRGNAPKTSAEVSALRAASGDVYGGSTISDNIRGMFARYNFKPIVVSSGRAEVQTKLTLGYGASVGLTVSKLPKRLRRFAGTFTGGHRVYIEDYHPSDGTVRWVDPLGKGLYNGERVKLDSVANAIWWGDVLMAKEGSAKGSLPATKQTGKDNTTSTTTTVASTASQWQKDLLDWAKERGYNTTTVLDTAKMQDFYRWMWQKYSIVDYSQLAYDLQSYTTMWFGATIEKASSPSYDPQQDGGSIFDPIIAPFQQIAGDVGGIARAIGFVLDPANWVHTGALLIGLGLTAYGGRMVLR